MRQHALVNAADQRAAPDVPVERGRHVERVPCTPFEAGAAAGLWDQEELAAVRAEVRIVRECPYAPVGTPLGKRRRLGHHVEGEAAR